MPSSTQTVAYADDMVIMATDRRDLENTVKNLTVEAKSR